MKLLLDEMYPPLVAERLRNEHGLDAVSVLERVELRGQPDGSIFDAAQHEQRAVVTENVPDFLRIARSYVAAGGVHYGLVLTTNRSFPRAQANTVARLVAALAELSASDAASNQELWL